MPTVRAEISVTLDLPDELECELAGGPDGDADNADAYKRLEQMITDHKIPMSDVSVDVLEPKVHHEPREDS